MAVWYGHRDVMRFLLDRGVHIHIRPGVPSDAAALAEFAARTFRETFAADNRPEDLEHHLAESYGAAQQGRELSDSRLSTLLGYVGGMLAGYAQLRSGPAPACVTGRAPVELWRFYVAGEWHGTGTAQALMKRVLAEAERLAARTVWLGVWERNERAKAFYRKCGFVDVGAQVFMLGGDAQTDRIMARSIASGAR